ncbi:MAG: hypothetical protein LBQ57_01665 [Spirochaetales bacterium]|jgi:uncharacterized cysteine cluster protein YcgN (CxxCxxCC family)|nr:hypothetical protein [Spirochaetales bacterium]
MVETVIRVLAEYRKHRKDWDALCRRCGLCCYERSVSRVGEVAVDLLSPCEYLDENSRLCMVYENRFRECRDCQKVNLFRALFHRYLPPGCAYARTFRVWKQNRPR